MMYVVRKGYSYVDTNGRNKVYAQGEEFAGKVDPKQKWKLGELKQKVEVPITTKEVSGATQTKKAKTKTEIDPMDEGEET
jgi:hypothetical protein